MAYCCIVRFLCRMFSVLFIFFFQAEDGIRDLYVTGVQTCALPIYAPRAERQLVALVGELAGHLGTQPGGGARDEDRKSTRLNSSHVEISYAVFCLKKKKNEQHIAHFVVGHWPADHQKVACIECRL